MKFIWNYIDGKRWREETKYRMAFLIVGMIFALAGLAAWLVVRRWALSTLDWMICFTGYPVMVSWFTVLVYSYGHRWS